MKKNKLTRWLQLSPFLLFQIFPIGLLLFYSFSYRTSYYQGGWVFDKEQQCRFYTYNNAENRHITWKGPCENGYIEGTGILQMYEGNRVIYRYEGQALEGKLHGFGEIFFFDDSDEYIGQFKNGLPHGKGVDINDDGDRYEGEWKKGQREGQGTYWYEPDEPYLKYIGEWKNDLQNGRGQLIYRNGKVKKGIFEAGNLISEEQPTTGKKQLSQNFPKNILITNDDGMEDYERLYALATALSPLTENVIIVTSKENRSSTTNYMSLARNAELSAEYRLVDSTSNIQLFIVDGYPADCVVLGSGIFQERGLNIDLVISGINGGPNNGFQWSGSGTIGAARMAAIIGIPAIAISGFEEEDNIDVKNNLSIISQWIVKLIQTDLIHKMEPLEYLTIAVPEKIQEIKGIKIVERAITFDNPPFYLSREERKEVLKNGKKYTWKIKGADPSKVYQSPTENDIFYYYQNYIVIVPMTVNENNSARLLEYQKLENSLPSIF